MDKTVYEPLARYRDEFRESFAQRARDAFASLLETSGVDVDANRALVARIKALTGDIAKEEGRKSRCGCGLVLLLVLALAAGAGLYFQDCIVTRIQPYCFAVLAGVVLPAVWLWKRRAAAAARLAKLQALLDDLRQKAWEQMDPLNRLYTWDIPLRLVEATVPRLEFDPIFTARRLADLHALCGWDDAFNDGKSVLGAQSGVINGNPFVFGECVEAKWGTKTYSGSLEISWLEEETDDEGHTHMVRRHETLTATVEKPIPVYPREKFLIYGNDAAPNLSFTRRPSGLSDAGDGFFANLRKKRELRKLEKFSRNLDDDSQYTLMANHEFEMLFETMDRDNEVEYRLLFTALAQMQMLQLLKDRTVGYGDDFSFLKRRKINVLTSTHLDQATIDTDPAGFRNLDVDAARAHFISFNERFFKDVYFTLAPILAIPLYQHTRSHEDIWRRASPTDHPSFWEHESLANFLGFERFRHPACVTECLLKTRELEDADGAGRVAVTAYGYRTEERVDYVGVHGGDGHWHDVPVRWDEYLPVERTREMSVAAQAAPGESFSQAFEQAEHSAARRALMSYLR